MMIMPAAVSMACASYGKDEEATTPQL
jgi:hypothetical protein